MAVIGWEPQAVEAFENGRSFANVGTYVLERATASFAVDPDDPANATICDLGRAERDEHGRVRYDADCVVLRPRDPRRGNGGLLLSVVNRGRMAAVPLSVDTRAVAASEVDAGDGFLLEAGWTVLWCGWQWDVRSGEGLLGLRAPEALGDDGRSIEGTVRVDFRSDTPILDHPLADVGALYAFEPYPAADPDQPDAVLTVRDGVSAPRQLIARDRWRFARQGADGPVTDPASLWLDGGFEALRCYEVCYRTDRSPVVGTGLLASRDVVSFLRHGSGALASPLERPVEVAIGMGVSQTGRYLRQFVAEGLNLDEQGRVVFDGILPHIAGARRGEFNQRYGQPSHIGYSGAAVLPPYSIDEHPGLFDRQRRLGGVPKVIATNTSWEYWRSDAALNHLDPTSGTDRTEGPDHRSYLFTGIDHLGPNPMKDAMRLANPANPLSGALLLRAAFSNLVAWVRDGREPPESAVPRLADGTAAVRNAVLEVISSIPGAVLPDPELLPRAVPTDLGPLAERGVLTWPARESEPLESYVSAVDEDGNEVAGVRLPEITVPVATYTGWNPDEVADSRPATLHEFPGSVFAFASDEAARDHRGDPRPSVAARYRDREEYEQRVTDAVADLVGRRHLLAFDAQRAIDAALVAYDRVMGASAPPGAGSSRR